MRVAGISAFVLAIILAVTAFDSPRAAAQTGCTSIPVDMPTMTGSWSSDCLSPNRPVSPGGPGNGDYYARYYDLQVSETSEVTITLESSTDTYLYLLSGEGRSGTVITENDDIDYDNRNFNSRITRTLDAGNYTIEATTYEAEATGDFTLTVAGIDFGAQPPPQPPPTPTLPECVERLPDAMTVDGAWTTDCKSVIAAREGSGDRYAKFYAFTLGAESDVTVALNSVEDTYLYLRAGTSTDGAVLHENDDIDTDRRNYNSRIAERLSAGDYTIEATTYYAGKTGDFTLSVAATPVSSVPPPQPPPPPVPTPPDSPIPAGCVLLTFSGASVGGSWTSDCVSRNRTENGDHYAKFFNFSVSRSSTIDLTLVSSVDTYLLLLDETGAVIDEDDDNDDGVFNLPHRSSGIRIALEPGSYIAEATTYAGETTGDFTVRIDSPEMAALRALYDDTDGANWTNSDNWFTDAPLSDWHGIKTDDEGRVTEIYLIGNNLDGEIPAELGRLGELEGLYLARNELSGSIPSELSNLSNLKTLMLFDNDLTGAIPYQFGNLESLEEIHLGRNKLSGRIPRQLGNLANLRRLHLTVNELSGSIPAELGKLSELRQLSIAVNNLTGYIPAEIANLSELTHIYLWGNDLTAGAFIRDLDKLSKLQFLDIGGNRIEGSYALAELSALDNLTGLGLHASNISDADLATYMDDLQALNLEFLNLSGNGLSDPQTLVGLSGITTLQRLAINGNDFRGELPRTMTRLTLMRLLYFHNNAGLCAPADTEFQDWFTGIRDRRGPTCTGGTPAHAPAPASGSADQFAGVIQTSEQLAPQDSLSALAVRLSGG